MGKTLFNFVVNKQVSVFIETIMNIFENFIIYETIICNDRDPPWMNKQIKTLIAEKNAVYKLLKRRMLNSKLLDKLDALQTKLQISITFCQFEHCRKISNIYLIHQRFWTLLNILLNGRKMFCISLIK